MTVRKPILILLTALLALLALAACQPVVTPPAAPAQATAPATVIVAAPGDTWEAVDCTTLGVAPELLDVAQCGYVTVPENRAAGTDTTIQLAVVKIPSTSATPGAPVFLGTGGPGGSGLQGATSAGGGATFLATHAPILADRDWIFFSQRGTAEARPPLICQAFNDVTLEAAINGWTVEQKHARSVEAMQACMDDYAAQGIDLTGYNSVENAEDINDIRQVLGYDKISYYGESYGTLLGQFLLRQHPEILDTIILDGIAPATAKHWSEVTKIPESFQRVFDACAADEACNTLYPDPAGALAQALDALKQNPPTFALDDGKGGKVDLKVDDTLAMNALFLVLYTPGGYAMLPGVIDKLSKGDYTPLNATIPFYFANSGTARGQHMAIVCSDDPVMSLDDVNLDVPEMYKGLILDDADSYLTVCPMIALPQLPDSSDELATSDIPALLLQGGMDPATPVEGGNKVQEGLPNSYNVIVPAGNHIQSHSPCVLNMMAAFMRDPQTAPDTSCIDPAVPFAVPFVKPQAVHVASPSGTAGLTMVLPAGYQSAQAPGQWTNGPALVALFAFDTGATVDDVAQQSAAQLPVKVDVTGGPVIAGYPSKAIVTDVDNKGTLVGVDIYVFGDESGVYKVAFNMTDSAAAIATFRQAEMPALLESITVGSKAGAAGADSALVETLGNLSYTGLVDNQPITLTAGVYTYPEPGSAGENHVQLLDQPIALGDLNGDGAQDAVALIEYDSTGSGHFFYLAPVLNVASAPAPATAVMLGDRIQVQSLAIADGQVVAEYIGEGPGDAACCPSWKLRSVFAWQDGGLVETSTEQLGKVGATQQTAAEALAAITDEDFALFQAASDASSKIFQESAGRCIEKFVPGAVTFPLAEPNYTAKRPLDLSAFNDALSGFSADRAAELDALVAGKTLPELQALMDDGRLSAEELVTYYADRIQLYDVNRLNTVLELNPDALALAAGLDAERAAGNSRGPLHGIPVLLKDNIATGDKLHTTAGAYALKDWQADRDAFLVQRLRDAGAIILGKANLSEWANYVDPCAPNGFSVLGGQTRNPYGPFDTLGSSSGSAASVAANLTAVSVGSETSGSLIQPARYNGVAALRPSQGLISRDHVIPLGPDLDTPGPMGRSVTDVALLLNAMTGVDENDPKTADAASLAGADFTQFLSLDEAKKLRVGVIIPTQLAAVSLQAKAGMLAKVTGKELTPEEQSALMVQEVLPELGGDPQVAIDALQAAGIEVVLIEDSTLPPSIDTARALLAYGFKQGVADLFGGLATPGPIGSVADVAAVNNEDLANRAPFGQIFIETAANDTTTPEEYVRIRAVAQALARNWMETVLSDNEVDVLVAGTFYSGNAGAAGVPALTVPAGLDPKGMPQGVIISGDYLSEPKLFAVAYALEQTLNGRVEPDLDKTIEQIDAVAAQ